jgi:hypothetical protein
MRFLSNRAPLPIVAGSVFVVGLLVNAAVRSPPTGHSAALAVPAFSAARGGQPAALGSARPSGLDPRFGYSAEVVHVIDGDTFEARVAVWPGIEIKTRVRLRGIDAPELHARCDHEWVRAQAARGRAGENFGAGRGNDCAGRTRQIRRAYRRRGLDPPGRFRGAPERRLGTQL